MVFEYDQLDLQPRLLAWTDINSDDCEVVDLSGADHNLYEGNQDGTVT